MPIPWLTVLKAVPWTEVIANAPKVADGARRLWNSVRGKSGEAAEIPPAPDTRPAGAGEADDLARLEQRLEELRGQMRASSELIDALATQNTQLIRHVEAQDRRLRRLTWGLVLLALAGLTGLILA